MADAVGDAGGREKFVDGAFTALVPYFFEPAVDEGFVGLAHGGHCITAGAAKAGLLQAGRLAGFWWRRLVACAAEAGASTPSWPPGSRGRLDGRMTGIAVIPNAAVLAIHPSRDPGSRESYSGDRSGIPAVDRGCTRPADVQRALMGR